MKEIIKQFVVETKWFMNIVEIVDVWDVWIEPLILIKE